MLEADQNKPNGGSMQPIAETQEWAEQSPPQSGQGEKKWDWHKLKDMITSFAEEEAKRGN